MIKGVVKRVQKGLFQWINVILKEEHRAILKESMLFLLLWPCGCAMFRASFADSLD